MIFLSHPTGNTFVRALLAGLETSGESYRFFTTLAFDGREPLPRWLPSRVKDGLSRRIYDVPPELIERRPLREWVRLLAAPTPLRFLTRHETGWASVDGVYRDLDRHVASVIRRHPPGTVYAYEDGALESFRAAGSTGASCCYDLPIAHWQTTRALLDEEAARLPQWERTLGGTSDSEEKYARKSEELALANLVICPSQFVLDSLPAEIRNRKRCMAIPFGSPTPPANPQSDSRDKGRLRVLFAGQLSQRKGLGDLFQAMRILRRQDVELIVMGSLRAPLEFYRDQLSDFRYEPPRPHAQVLELMASCDVFVLPSIVEGRALVQQEALSCGLPLIVTANAGAEDLIDEGRTGFLVPVRSPEKIAEKIAWFADHRSELPAMKEWARAKAGEYSWKNYAAAILDAVNSVGAGLKCV